MINSHRNTGSCRRTYIQLLSLRRQWARPNRACGRAGPGGKTAAAALLGSPAGLIGRIPTWIRHTGALPTSPAWLELSRVHLPLGALQTMASVTGLLLSIPFERLISVFFVPSVFWLGWRGVFSSRPATLSCVVRSCGQRWP